MRTHCIRQTASLLFSFLLLCPQARAQNPAAGKTPHNVVQGGEDPKRAQKAAARGAKAEAEGHLSEALADYDEAARYAPFEETIVGRAAALRSKLVRVHVEAAENAAISGNIRQATEELHEALLIDPGNTIVQERLVQMQSMEEEPAAKAEQTIAGLPRLRPQETKHSFNLRTDTKSAYEQIAETFGVKASFDPDLTTRNVRLRVDDVDFYTAMALVGAETASFWRPLNPTLIFVAADTPEKRKQYGVQAEQTFSLPAAVGPEEMTELLRVLREITGAAKIDLDTKNHSITVRDTPEKLALAGALIRELEKARGELMLQIDLLEVDHNNAQSLGITPPTSLRLFSVDPRIAQQLSHASKLADLLALLATIFGGPVGAAAASGALNLSSLIPSVVPIGGGESTFLLTVPGTTATFADALSLMKQSEQILLRAQSGKPATFFVGDRYPVTLSLLSASLGATNFTANPGGISSTIPLAQFTVGQDPVALVAADFRNNGSQDIATANQLDNTITILLNQGTGASPKFVQATGSPISLGIARTVAPPVPVALASASLNPGTGTGQDSFPDLLVTDPVGNTVTILLANSTGDGTFTPQGAPIAVGNEPSAIAAVQFTTGGNTNFGFVVTNFKDNTYSVFTGDGTGNFTPKTGSPFPLPSTEKGPIAITVADFNNDGISDLAIVNETTNNVAVLQGQGDGTFTEFPGSPITVGTLPVAIASGTLSGSTGPALAVANQAGNTVSVLLGKGDGTFTAASQSPLASGQTPTGVVISDFLQQQNGGIAVSNAGPNSVSVYIGIGSGLFTRVSDPGAGTSPTAIVAASFSSSSFPDLAVTNNISGAAGQVSIILNPASFVTNPQLAQQPYPGSEYIDLGLKVKATPLMHANDEVTLQLEMEIKSLTGRSTNGIPIISNRSIGQTIRVKEGEPTLIVGVMDRELANGVSGYPGLATVPGIGYAFGRRDTALQDTELLILITPRKLRFPARESHSIFAGRGDTGGRGSVGANAPPGNPQP